MRDELSNKIEQNLQKQLAIYTELRDSAQKKQEALVKNQIKELDALVTREEMLIIEAGKLEVERNSLIEKIALELKIPIDEVNLSKLIINKPIMVKTQDELLTLVKDIQEIHSLNSELLKQAIMIVEFSLNLLTEQNEKTYTREMNKVEKGKQKINKAFILDKSI